VLFHESVPIKPTQHQLRKGKNKMDLMKGNFKTKNAVEGTPNEVTAEENFEREALSKLGGSIAFTSKKKFLWKGEENEEKEIEMGGRAEQYDSE
jgi:hypothetical protein